MEELIAKRYIKAIKSSSDIESMQNMTVVFAALAESFSDEKFNQIMNNPDVSADQKSEFF
jgi:F-type H+-transporting ATPase subunit delta